MDCVSFWTWLAAGTFIVPLLGWLKRLPTVGPIVEQWAFLLAPMLSAIAPALAQWASPYCAQIDPLLWTAAFAGLTYLVSQIVYWINRRFVGLGRKQ